MSAALLCLLGLCSLLLAFALSGMPSDKRTIWALLLRQWPCALIRMAGTYYARTCADELRTLCTLDSTMFFAVTH